MKKRISGISLLFLLIVVLSNGCKDEISTESIESKKSIISGIQTGMTSKEVFEVFGEEYDNKDTTENYKNTVEYDYYIEDEKVFGTEMPGYVFFEFDSQTDKLKTFGYHLGQKGDFSDPTYPYSEEELKETYCKIRETVSDWYGEGSSTSKNSEYNVREERIWQEKDDQIWMIYGVNLWGMDEPEFYQNGVNEIVLSCDVSSDKQTGINEEKISQTQNKTIGYKDTYSVTTLITSENEIISEVTKENEIGLSESEIDLVKNVYMEVFRCDEYEAASYIEYIKQYKDDFNYSDHILGKIESENNAKEKGRLIIAELYGEDFIADLESDYVILNGTEQKFTRYEPPYCVKYLEKYDVWTITPVLKSGIIENGNRFATPGEMSTVAIRASDGKVLAVMI